MLISSLLSILAFKYFGANSLLILATDKCLQTSYITADNNLIDNILLNSDLAVALQDIYPGVNSLLTLTILALIAHWL